MTEQPLRVNNAEELSWDAEADVVVAGFGGAGAAAAIEARERGLDVLALDRFDGGGATALSGGVTYAAGTPYQLEAGYTDDADNMFAYLSREKQAVSLATLRRFCDTSAEMIAWLSAHGVPFSGRLYPGKISYPPEDHFLYHSGNEKAPAFSRHARPAPRGHRAVGRGFTGGVHFAALKQAALAQGAKLIADSPVTRLIVDADGAVIGVEALAIPPAEQARHQAFYDKLVPLKPFVGKKYRRMVDDCREFEARFAERRRIRARRGVILATGGFVYNSELVCQHRPQLTPHLDAMLRLGSMGCDGSGIALGESVGGTTNLMDRLFIGRVIAPPPVLIKAVLVNQAGERFVNEDAYLSTLGNAIAEAGSGGAAWLVLDAATMLTAVKQCLMPGKGMYKFTVPTMLNILFGGTRFAGSLAALARKCGVPAPALEETVATYNLAARRGEDAFGKAAENLVPIGKAPYFAIDASLGNPLSFNNLFTLGGLRVDEATGAVLRDGDEAIEGLFAAGRAAVGLCSESYISGMSIADTVFSGRRAARAIAEAHT